MDVFVELVLRDQVHFPPDELRKAIRQRNSLQEQVVSSRKVHEKVDVTIWPFLPTGYGPEYPQPARSILLRERDELAQDIAEQIQGGSRSVFGVMIESHLNAGAQKYTPGKDDQAKLAYGQSITDACLGWEDSLAAIDVLAQAVRLRRG